MLKHRLRLVTVLAALLAATAACGSGSGAASGGASAPAPPDPAEASGSAGAYVAPTDPSAALCKHLDYGPLKGQFNTLSGDPTLENLGGGSSNRGARCSQQLADTGGSQADGRANGRAGEGSGRPRGEGAALAGSLP